MKTIETNLFQFNELSDMAKETAIEKYREQMYTNSDIASWVIDDCYLFEASNNELIELFGNEYAKLDIPIIGNNRNIYYSVDINYHIDADQAIIINNEKMFLLWLGIPELMHNNLCYSIVNNSSRYPDTKIEFNPNEYDYEFTNDELMILENAEYKFSDHMESVLNRIKQNLEYYYSDEYIKEEIQNNDEYFTENGIKY